MQPRVVSATACYVHRPCGTRDLVSEMMVTEKPNVDWGLKPQESSDNTISRLQVRPSD